MNVNIIGGSSSAEEQELQYRRGATSERLLRKRQWESIIGMYWPHKPVALQLKDAVVFSSHAFISEELRRALGSNCICVVSG